MAVIKFEEGLLRCICQMDKQQEQSIKDIEQDTIQCNNCKCFVHKKCVGIESDLPFEYICLYCMDESINFHSQRRQRRNVVQKQNQTNVHSGNVSDNDQVAINDTKEPQTPVMKRKRGRPPLSSPKSQSPASVTSHINNGNETDTPSLKQQQKEEEQGKKKLQIDMQNKQQQLNKWKTIKKKYNQLKDSIELISWLGDSRTNQDFKQEDLRLSRSYLVDQIQKSFDEYSFGDGIEGAVDAYKLLINNFNIFKGVFEDEFNI